jgi:hypothetical protein
MTMTDATLSLEQQQGDVDDGDYDLDERILSIVANCPKQEIRPAKLGAKLGISLEDACAELCGLLAAVGEGSSFRFDGDVMVFTFPPDFEKRARRYRRRQTIKESLGKAMQILVKFIKILTAFGLILSLLIVTVAAMIGLVAAIIAMSRAGHGGGHRNDLMRRLHSMFYTMRQLLWCYAMFGGNIQGQDPFLQEIAYDMALMTSLCCGNPGSLFFWMRASQLHNRRRQRGWAPLNRNQSSNLEGVALVQRGTWGREEEDTPGGEQEEPCRGLLSVSVEFLFGHSPFVPGPTEPEKWKLRGAIIVQLSSRDAGNGVSLQELSPYVDSPPASLQCQSQIVAEGLSIVAHFNGRPLAKDSVEPPTMARFLFPELMAESISVVKYEEAPDPDDGSWEYLLYSGDVNVTSTRTGDKSYQLPSSLQERRYLLTMLEKKQFQQCVLLGILNFIGVFCLRQSLEPGAVLDISNMAGGILSVFLMRGLMPVLHFYSLLFFVLPLARLLIVVVLNAVRERRNRRRADFAHALKTNLI